jgi:UDP-glucose 4-epimerase
VKTFLVTGAAGFIGAAVARYLVGKGNEVVTVDNLSTGYKEAIPTGVEFYEGNCQDEYLINQLEKYDFEAIFHIAGQSSGEISFDNPIYDLQTNTQSTLLLLKLALKTKCTKFIYASTMSVYGDAEKLPVNESMNIEPKSFYAVGKIASEHYMRIYQNYGIRSSALRLFNVYGPGQNLENLRQGMISIYLAQAINNRHIIVKGPKERFRDFVFIDDVVNAFILACENLKDIFCIYNVCTGIKATVEEVINIIKNNLDFPIDIIYKGSTPGDQFGIYGDASLFKRATGWQPRVNLEEGLKKMIAWAINR